MAALHKKPPAYVVVRLADLVYDVNRRRNHDPWLQLSRLPSMRQFVRERYEQDTRIGYLVLFRRKGG